MTNTICGHERSVLIWALGYPYEDTETICSPRFRYNGCPKCKALREIADPAKLAAIMAEDGKRLGLSIAIVAYGNAKPLVWELDGDGGWISMAQARAIILDWLQLPDGAREEAETVLRGET
jgi:hypothetical protein